MHGRHFFLVAALLIPNLNLPMAYAEKVRIQPYDLNCAPPAQFRSPTKQCSENTDNVEAGVACINRVDQLVKEKNAELKKALEALRTGKNQNQKLGEAALSYEAVEQELLRLLATSALATNSVRGYLDNLVFPEGWDHEEQIKDYDAFFKSEPCFAESREILFENLEDVSIIRSDLNEVLALTRSMKSKAVASRTGLSGPKGNVNTSVKGGKTSDSAPKGSAAGEKKGGPRKGPNTITGIEQDKAKRSQKR